MDNEGYASNDHDRTQDDIFENVEAQPESKHHHHHHDSEEKKAYDRAMRERSMSVCSSVTEAEDQITFSWENLTVATRATRAKRNWKCQTVEGKGSKVLVDNVSGYIKPGELVAIMGASGAGKSTLLNSLLFRNIKGLSVKGTRYINGIPVDAASLTAVSAYIQQDDLFIGTLTPKEHLQFQARVRMESSIPRKVRMERVEQVLRELGLTKCQNTLIGIAGRIKGISGGESKRLAFASEILTNPPMLFCDEPTSGLDSYMAQSVVETLRSLARQGKTIICTIHQPSSQVFALFDRVLLMAEGRMAYLGDIDKAYRFFARVGYPCPEMFNPADHYVHVLAITPGKEEECKARVRAICQEFRKSEEGDEVINEVQYQKTHHHNVRRLEQERALRKRSPYRASWFQQFRALLWRGILSIIKEPAVVQFIGLLFGIVYLQQDYDQEGVFNINSALFVLITNLTFSNVFAVINVYTVELPIFLREHFNGAYRTDTYFITKQLAELPIFLIFPAVLVTIMYWMIGLNPAADRFFMCILIAILLVQVITSFGYFVSTISTSLQMALGLAPVMMIPLLLFGGFFLRSDTVPDWLSWIEYISWFKYGNEAFVVNQWRDYGAVECNNANETISLDCPDFVPDEFCPNDTWTIELPTPCGFKNGEDIITGVGLNADNFVFDLCMLVVMFVVLRVAAFLALLAKTYRQA